MQMHACYVIEMVSTSEKAIFHKLNYVDEVRMQWYNYRPQRSRLRSVLKQHLQVRLYGTQGEGKPVAHLPSPNMAWVQG